MDDNNGTVGEKLVAKFFDEHFSKVFSFPNPKTKSNAEVADVLVWMNRTVFLIEVKTRDRSKVPKVPVESWAESKQGNKYSCTIHTIIPNLTAKAFRRWLE